MLSIISIKCSKDLVVIITEAAFNRNQFRVEGGRCVLGLRGGTRTDGKECKCETRGGCVK